MRTLFNLLLIQLIQLGAGLCVPQLGLLLASEENASRIQVEQEMSAYYQGLAQKILNRITPERNFSVLVEVKLDPSADLDLPKDDDSAFRTFPGMPYRTGAESSSGEKWIKLPHTKHLLVLTPVATKPSVENVANTWLRKMIPLATNDEISFQSQASLLKDLDPNKQPNQKDKPEDKTDSKKEDKAEDKKEDKKSDMAIWIIALILILLLIIGLILLAMRKQKPTPKKPKTDPKDKSDPSKGKTSTETSQQQEAILKGIEEICTYNSETASAAFQQLLARPEEAKLTAMVIQRLGINKALTYFPKVPGETWFALGEAINSLTNEDQAKEEELRNFHRLMSGEIARALREKDQEKLLPKLSEKPPKDILRVLKAKGPRDTALAFVGLQPHLIPTVVKEMGKKDISQALASLMDIQSAKMNEFKELDQPVDSETDAEIELKPEEILASVLSYLDAIDEFTLFNEMIEKKQSLLASIMPYRLLPNHLPFLPDDFIREVLLDLELDEVKQVIDSSDPSTQQKMLSFLTDKQRAVVESSEAADSSKGPSVLRKFLADIHSRRILSKDHVVKQIFEDDKNSSLKGESES